MTSTYRRLRRHLEGLAAAAVTGFTRPRVRLLLLSDDREYTSEQQFAPIWRHRWHLRRKLGLAVDWRPLQGEGAEVEALLPRYDAIGIKLSFRRPAPEAEAIVRRLRQAGQAGRKPRFVYFDGDDDSAVLWPEVVDLVDLYVKKHLFTDPVAYGRSFQGKSNLTDYAARHGGWSFASDIIPIGQPSPLASPERLHLGWSIALDDEISRLPTISPRAHRSIDLCGRVHVAPGNWLEALRAPAIKALESAGARWRVAVPRERVSQAAYQAELRSARLCVSPFGYGELCWRDFEATRAGCLLVKPDTGHIRTDPELFVPGITYVPVRWDFADLEQACLPYLRDEERRVAMVEEAQRRLRESLSGQWFAGRMAALLARLYL